jgi:hypothetical protein
VVDGGCSDVRFTAGRGRGLITAVKQSGDDDQHRHETSRGRPPRPPAPSSTHAATPCPAGASDAAAGAGRRTVTDTEQQSFPSARAVRRSRRGEMRAVRGSGIVARSRRRVLNRLVAAGDPRCGYAGVSARRVTGVGRLVGGKQVRGSVKHQR